MSNYSDLIKEICEEENIKYSLVSNGWVRILDKNNKTRFIQGYKFDLNTSALANIFDDKFACFDVLNHFHIPIVFCHLLYKNYDEENLKTLFLKYNKDVVIRANNGTCGRSVFHVLTWDDLIKTLDKLFVSNYSVSLSPFYNIKTEYRIIVLKGKIKLIYGKKRPVVIGDGKKNLQTLLEEFNYNYFKNKKIENRVPLKGEVCEYGWQFNLSRGSVSFIVDNHEVINILSKLVNDIIEKINIQFGSIDIIDVDGNYMVIEINSGVMMDNFMLQQKEGRKIAKSIYKEAIEACFEEDNNE